MGEVNPAVRVWEPGTCSSASPARETVQVTWTVTWPPGRNALRSGYQAPAAETMASVPKPASSPRTRP
jgi:hypothetical protein